MAGSDCKDYCALAAIMFWSTKPTGELNKESLHEACPVIKGVKWSAAKWIHMAPYAMDGQQPVTFEEVVYKQKEPGETT